MSSVDPSLIVGVTTEAISAEGLILTAGGLDVHVHFICPQICTEAISSGLTTLLGGGTGPATGTNATTCTPSPFYIQSMLKVGWIIDPCVSLGWVSPQGGDRGSKHSVCPYTPLCLYAGNRWHPYELWLYRQRQQLVTCRHG